MNYYDKKHQQQFPQQIIPSNTGFNIPANQPTNMQMNIPMNIPPCMMMPNQYNMPGTSVNGMPQSNMMDMDDFSMGMFPNDLPTNSYNWPMPDNAFHNMPMMSNVPMMSEIPKYLYNDYQKNACPPTSIKADELQKILELIKEAVSGETHDRLFYDYLISVAPCDEEKDLIKGIRDDEIKHFGFFRDLYKELTGVNLPATSDGDFQKPKSYCDGLKDALLGEQRAVQKYRQILFALVERHQINKLIEIITDEIRHGSIYNYLYARNKCVK